MFVMLISQLQFASRHHDPSTIDLVLNLSLIFPVLFVKPKNAYSVGKPPAGNVTWRSRITSGRRGVRHLYARSFSQSACAHANIDLNV